MNAVAIESPAAVCTGCNGKKRVYSLQRRRRIDCPHCTGMGTAAAQQNLVALKLTGAEKRRIDQAKRMIEAAVQLAAALETRNPATIHNSTAAAVNRIMERWAVGHGDGLPPDDAGALKAQPPRLDDATQCVIDHIVNDAPAVAKKLIVQWYRRERPVWLMAESRGISVRAMYHQWHASLQWLASMFRASKHADLVRMLKIRGT